MRKFPVVSVICPVLGQIAGLDRSIRSVRDQAFTDWELLIVDFGAQNKSNRIIESWSARDERIRGGCVVKNPCSAVALNAALVRASGEVVTYLEPGDVYYPDYLAQITSAAPDYDVLLSDYDVDVEDYSGKRKFAQSPANIVGQLFVENVLPSFAVAHRRSVVECVGGFNELLWYGEHRDFLKRLARAGLRFRALPMKCGHCNRGGEKAYPSAAPHAIASRNVDDQLATGKASIRQ